MINPKYINQINVVLIVVTATCLLVSAGFVLKGVKTLANNTAELGSIKVNVPTLTKQDIPYTEADYMPLKKRLDNEETTVKVQARSDKLVISALSINNELEWKRVVSDALALDQNLRTIEVCGSAANACSSGAALVAEISGQRQRVFVQQQGE